MINSKALSNQSFGVLFIYDYIFMEDNNEPYKRKCDEF